MNQIKEIAQYCAKNIEDWDIKAEMALRMIGRRMPIDPGFRNEIEDAVYEWCDENDVSVDFYDEIDVEEIVLWGE